MAKLSLINRELKRTLLVKKYKGKRDALLALTGRVVPPVLLL